MDLVIGNHLIFDCVLRFIPFREKLRLRLLNEDAKDGVESWLRRYRRRLKIQVAKTKEQLVKEIELSAQELNGLVINFQLSEEVWSAIESRLRSAKQINFQRPNYVFLAWRDRIQFQELRCEKIIFEANPYVDDRSKLGDLLDDLEKCPNLESIYFVGGFASDYLRCLANRDESFLFKIRQLGQFMQSHLTTKTSLNHILSRFPNLAMLSMGYLTDEFGVSGNDWSQRETADIILDCPVDNLQHLEVENALNPMERLMASFWLKWPNLR